MRMRTRLGAVVASAMVWSFAACGGSGNGGGNPTPSSKPELGCDGGEPETSFSDVYTSVVSTSCLNGCHTTGTSDTGPVVLSSADAGYSNLVGATSISYGSALKLVDPHNPEGSTLYLKLLGGTPAYRGPNGESVGGPMPPTGSPTVSQKELVRQWICSGAQP